MLVHFAKRKFKSWRVSFHYQDKRLLSQDWFVTSVQEALTTAGVNCKLHVYAGHGIASGEIHQSESSWANFIAVHVWEEVAKKSLAAWVTN